MSVSCAFPRYRGAMMVASAAVAAVMMSGCSSDATRFSDPFSNPFGSPAADRMATGSIARPAPVGSVQAGYLPPPRAVVRASVYAQPAPMHVAVLAPGTTLTNVNGWTANGGTPVVVAQGEGLAVIARRYGIPPAAILHANGFSAVDDIRPGVRVIIPIYRPGAAVVEDRPVVRVVETRRKVVEVEEVTHRHVHHADHADESADRPVHRAHVADRDEVEETHAKEAKESHHKAQEERGRDETVVVHHHHHDDDAAEVPAPTHGKKKPAKEADEAPVKEIHKKAADAAPVKGIHKKMAEEVTVKDVRKKVAMRSVEPAPKAPKVAMAPSRRAGGQVASVDHMPVVDPTPTSSLPPQEPQKPEFRWPARGRIIQGFHPGSNDGINIALPEGTSIKAAEGGVVAYAGNELKGYGNMVLIRHPNGYVSAYANNGELSVKRGDQIKRGQIIAKSGATGNATGPQLHFELRKGSTPVDPTGYLAGL